MSGNPRFDLEDLTQSCELFDQVCRRWGIGDEHIGKILGHSRQAVGGWRGRRAVKTAVPFPVLLQACRITACSLVPAPNMQPGGPQLYGLVPLAAAEAGEVDSIAVGAENMRVRAAHRRQVRLRAYLGGLGIAAVLVLMTGSHSVNPLDWGREIQRIVDSFSVPGGGGGSATMAARPIAHDPMVGLGGGVPASPVATGTVSDTPQVPGPLADLADLGGDSGSGSGSGSGAGGGVVAIGTGPDAAHPPPPGLGGTSDPRGAGGVTGTVKEGDAYAGGTIDDLGIRGCAGVTTRSGGGLSVCGERAWPVPLPIPALPAPTDLLGQPPQPPWSP